MDFSLYKGKKVFLTGHTGFKGSWMLTWLCQLGAIVKGYSLAPENENDLFSIISGEHLCESVIANILDKSKLTSEIVNFQPDFIFHLAAQPLVRLSYELPVETFEINAIGTAHVLEASRYLKKSCSVVLITTDKVYENREWHYPYRETDRLGGYDPYSASKACAELIISSYRSSFFGMTEAKEFKKGIASARAGNVIGGGDWAKDRLIPDIVKALQNNEKIIVRNPNAVRPWQHVLEPVSGYLLLGLKLYYDPIKYSQSWNFGPFAEDNLTVSELVEMGIKIWGKGEMISPLLENQPHEAGLLKLEIQKSIHELGWKPKWSSLSAITKTLEWYKMVTNSNPLELLKKDIKEYINA